MVQKSDPPTDPGLYRINNNHSVNVYRNTVTLQQLPGKTPGLPYKYHKNTSGTYKAVTNIKH